MREKGVVEGVTVNDMTSDSKKAIAVHRVICEEKSDKEQVCNLCKKVLVLTDDVFNIFIEEMNSSDDPVIRNLCNFLERKRVAL